MKRLIALIMLMAVTGWGLPQGDATVSGTLKTDTITENTTDNGVKVENITVKDNDINLTSNLSIKDSSDSAIVTIDEINKWVGIGTSSPTDLLHVDGDLRTKDTRITTVNTTCPENSTYQRMKITVGSTNKSALVEVKVLFSSSVGLFPAISHGIFSIGRRSSDAEYSIISLENETVGGLYSGLLTPEVSGNDIIFGVHTSNNGTSSTFNVYFEVKITSDNIDSFTVSEVTGTTAATGGQYKNYVNDGAMVIDYLGNMGIGTSSPSYKSDVYSSSGSVVSRIQSASLADGQAVQCYVVGSANSTSRVSNLSVIKMSGQSNPVSYLALATEDNTQFYFWVSNADQFMLSSTMSNVGTTSGRKILSEDTSGNVGIGTTSPDAKLHVYGSGQLATKTQSTALTSGQFCYYSAKAVKSGGSNNRTADLGVVYYDQHLNGGSDETCGYLNLTGGNGVSHLIWTDNSNDLRISSTVGHIGSTNGTVVGTQTSDIRLKTDIKPLSYGLKEILALDTISFKYKDGGRKSIGFTAQQTQPIIPEAVYDTKEKIDDSGKTRLNMYYVNIIPVLVNAIKEQQVQINQLKLDIIKLKGE